MYAQPRQGQGRILMRRNSVEEEATGAPDFDVRVRAQVRDRDAEERREDKSCAQKAKGRRRALMMMTRRARVPRSACGCIGVQGTEKTDNAPVFQLRGSVRPRHDGLKALRGALRRGRREA